MRDINDLSGSTEIRRLPKRSLPDAAAVIKSAPSTPGNGVVGVQLFNAEEKVLLHDFSSQSLEAIERIKKVFPGARVTEVRPREPARPPTELELREKAMAEQFQRKCEIRGSLMAELDQLWPRILKERRRQRRDREGKKTQVLE